MANQTITSSSNHDNLTGRGAGEDITIQQGAVLTINSCPHLTSMGILGDLTLTAGTVHIDGRDVKEIVYSSGSGTLPSAIPTTVTWDSGASTGKIIRYDSGTNASGTVTITVITGTLEASDVITDGTWTATVDSVAVGFLVVFGEDQDWGSVDAQSTLRINGDWYEVGIGDGTNSQVITLPHTGHQHAVWVETGSGTDVFEIWHRVDNSGAGTVYFNSVSQWGNNYESGFVFGQTFGNSTVTFGTSTAGGVPPSGARIRIPNVHLGTTSVGTPTTEVNSATLASHISILQQNTNLNVEIDHLNASSVRVDSVGTNAVVFKDSCFALATIANFIGRVNSTVYWENVAMVNPGNGTGGIAHGNVQTYLIQDNVGGIEMKDCVIYGGANASNNGALMLTTMSNISFTGTCKIVQNQQDENTSATIRGSVASNLTAETLILIGGYLLPSTGCNNWTIDEVIFGLAPGRGTTEQNSQAFYFGGCDRITINSGRFANGSKPGTNSLFYFLDCSNITITNFGEVDAKLNCQNRVTSLFNIAGISSNIIMKRLYFTNTNTTQSTAFLNTAANILMENCGGDYNDEVELDINRTILKGYHGGSGGIGATTGIEDDLVNCIGTCFYDLFTSNTTGFVGLVFNDKGSFHATDVTVTSGSPFFNGLGDLVMNTIGDQIVYEFPYWILGHTGFANTNPSKVGTTPTNISAEYALDTGSGYGSWTSATGANLSAETISPSGFKIKFRFTTTTGTNQNLRGFAVYTTTTIEDQKDNLYPIKTYTITLTGLQAGSEVRFYEGSQSDPSAAQEIDGIESSGTSVTLTHSIPGVNAYIVIAAISYVNQIVSFSPLSASDQTIPIQQITDRVYSNT